MIKASVQNRVDFLKVLKYVLPLSNVGVEIGVLFGDFSDMILEILKPKELFLIDPYRPSRTKYGSAMNFLPTAYSNEEDYLEMIKRFNDEIKAGQVISIKDFSYNAVSSFENKSLDFIYMDASHKYDDVERDLKDWLPKLKDNGFMCGHDYTEHPDFGVTQAVDEFCKEHNFEMVIFNKDGGDWALKRINE